MIRYKRNETETIPYSAKRYNEIPQEDRWLYYSQSRDITTGESLNYKLRETVLEGEVKGERTLPSCYVKKNECTNYYVLDDTMQVQG